MNTTKTDNSNMLKFRADEKILNFVNEYAEKYNISKSQVLKMALYGKIEKIEEIRSRKVTYMNEEQGREIKEAICSLVNVMNLYKVKMNMIGKELNRIGVNYNQDVKFRSEKHLPNLPIDAVTKLLSEYQKVSADCNDEIDKYGEVLLWHMQE